jgi:hypothetical protein
MMVMVHASSLLVCSNLVAHFHHPTFFPYLSSYFTLQCNGHLITDTVASSAAQMYLHKLCSVLPAKCIQSYTLKIHHMLSLPTLSAFQVYHEGPLSTCGPSLQAPSCALLTSVSGLSTLTHLKFN